MATKPADSIWSKQCNMFSLFQRDMFQPGHRHGFFTMSIRKICNDHVFQACIFFMIFITASSDLFSSQIFFYLCVFKYITLHSFLSACYSGYKHNLSELADNDVLYGLEVKHRKITSIQVPLPSPTWEYNCLKNFFCIPLAPHEMIL